jgi:hypothetical protein
MSRSDRLSPCAPIGGKICAAWPASISRSAPKRCAIMPDSGQHCGFETLLTLPSIDCMLRSIMPARSFPIERRNPFGFRRRLDPDEAGAPAAHRHLRERTGARDGTRSR